MANTHKLIASYTVGSGGTSSIDFTSIPNTYTDLRLVLSGRAAATGWTTSGLRLTVNGAGGTAYATKQLYNTAAGGGGSTSTSSAAYISGAVNNGSSSTSSTFSSTEFYFPNYTSSNAKLILIDSVSENNGSDTAQVFIAGSYSGASAISSISIIDVNGNFVQYTNAYLYGINNA